MKKPKLISQVLQKDQKKPKENLDNKIAALQKRILKIQQGVWHTKARVILVFEGFDAAGKGGSIRKITEKVDPRGVTVYPIAAPDPEEQSKHYLYRFWQKLPRKGTIAIFDRSWYGRLLVEKVEELTPAKRLKQADQEINEFERLLADDGIVLVKFFLAVSKDEQLQRYQDRLQDPTKRWKLTEDDLKARKKWKLYVKAADHILKKTSHKHSPWFVIPSDYKDAAQFEVLSILVDQLGEFERWMTSEESKWQHDDMKKKMKKMLKSSEAKA